MYERSELDWLVYNAPVDYINLVLNGDIQSHLKKLQSTILLKTNPLKRENPVFDNPRLGFLL